MSFVDTSKEIAADFLQSVLIVDDRAYDGVKDDEDEIHGELISPGRPSSSADGDTEEESNTGKVRRDDSVETPPEEEAEDDELHDLDAEEITRGFLKHHIFCSVLSPTEEELSDLPDLFEQVKPIAARTDIAVFDWVLNPGGDGEGGEATELISRIIEDDRGSENRDRVRLIAIYTGTKDLPGIADSIQESLEGVNPAYEVIRDNKFTLTMGGTRIAVYAKRGTVTEDSPDPYERQKSVRELPMTLIEEFSEMTRGLVSNAAVRSLTALRDNTFSLISTFDKTLDAPYLEHRSMLFAPEESQDYLVRLITSEIGSVLESADLRDVVDESNIERWVHHNYPKMEPAELFLDGHEPNLESILHLLIHGAGYELPEDLEPMGRNGKNAHKKKISQAISPFPENKDEHVFEFAALTLFKTRYGGEIPRLNLGAVIYSNEEVDERREKKYWLCVQPRCDSVRITEGARRFPLLPLKLIDGNARRHLVLRDEGSFKKLKIDFTPHRVRMESFAPSDGNDVIKATKFDSDLMFVSTSGKKYAWLAELKFEQAQRIAQSYSNKLSRVGLDESEWLRRKAPRY